MSDKLDLLEQFHKEHQGTYNLDALSKLIIDAFYLGEQENLEAVQRVRELHKPIDGIGVKVCAICIEDHMMYWTEQAFYPCATIKALDGEQ